MGNSYEPSLRKAIKRTLAPEKLEKLLKEGLSKIEIAERTGFSKWYIADLVKKLKDTKKPSTD